MEAFTAGCSEKSLKRRMGVWIGPRFSLKMHDVSVTYNVLLCFVFAYADCFVHVVCLSNYLHDHMVMVY